MTFQRATEILGVKTEHAMIGLQRTRIHNWMYHNAMGVRLTATWYLNMAFTMAEDRPSGLAKKVSSLTFQTWQICGEQISTWIFSHKLSSILRWFSHSKAMANSMAFPRPWMGHLGRLDLVGQDHRISSDPRVKTTNIHQPQLDFYDF